MASVLEKQRRETIITKALLLGYTFEETTYGYVFCSSPQGGTGAFVAKHLTAEAALKHAGVPYDAKKSSGDLGVGSGARYRLRGRQRLRGSAKRVPESSGA